jgi:O-6-methylguanine DNA methyltransferase
MINLYHEAVERVLYAAAIEDGKILATSFASNTHSALEYVLQSLPYDIEFQMAEKFSSYTEKLFEILHLIYLGKPNSWNFELEIRYLSDYAKKVLSFLSEVPIGYVTTYQVMARVTGGSPRAIGRVMATNPFPLLIPCHRVICADFTLGGFGLGGVKVKQELLQREDKGYKKPTELRIDNKVLNVFPVGFLWKD